MAQPAPIALFVYNRADHLAQTLTALKANVQASESELFIFSDAPKNDAAVEAVAKVRKTIRLVTGFKAVHIIERLNNFGLANSIIDGVTQLVNQYGRIIVLEDDLVTSPYFLSYMNDALDRYEHEERVMQISGHMFPVELDLDKDAFFLPFTTSWGWGTWQRAWQVFEPSANAFQLLKKNKKLRKSFDLNGAYPYFKMLQSQQQGLVDSWAIRWNLSVFMSAGLTLFPVKTLVMNAGFDGSGTHCGNQKIGGQLNLDFIPEKFPDHLTISGLSQKKVYDYLATQQDRWSYFKYKIYKTVRMYE